MLEATAAYVALARQWGERVHACLHVVAARSGDYSWGCCRQALAAMASELLQLLQQLQLLLPAMGAGPQCLQQDLWADCGPSCASIHRLQACLPLP